MVCKYVKFVWGLNISTTTSIFAAIFSLHVTCLICLRFFVLIYPVRAYFFILYIGYFLLNHLQSSRFSSKLQANANILVHNFKALKDIALVCFWPLGNSLVWFVLSKFNLFFDQKSCLIFIESQIGVSLT